MVAFVIKDFGGEVPRREPRLLPDNMATRATNVDLAAGPLDGLPQPEHVIDLSGAPWPVRRAYRCPGPTSADPEVWLPLPSEFSSVCRSPLANDTQHRYYWTNPPSSPDAGAWWNTYAGIAAGTPHYSMGFIPVDLGGTLTVTATGGTTTTPQIDRSYCYTYVDAFGSESSPSLPSPVVSGYPDSTWSIAGFPTTPPPSPAGKNYPPPVKMRLYRTITGDTTGAQFYFVVDIPFGTASYVDTIPDTTVVNNNLLESTSWAPPVDGLDGLISMPGGMMVGFTDSTVHFCEPNRPHAWPAGYDQSLLYPIVGLAIWQQALVVLTNGYPSTGTGTSPAQFVFAQVQAPEPCIARGSIVTDLAGVYYASANGIIALNYYGMQNQTLTNLTRAIWMTRFRAEHIVACRHRAQYLAINGSGMGFIVDYTEERLGICSLSPFLDVVCVWNDAFTGDAYVIADDVVYKWDSVNTPSMIYRWRSREFYFPKPVSLGACQISLDPSVSLPAPEPVTPPPDTPMRNLELPNGVNALIRLYAGPSQGLVHEQWLQQERCLFRLPGGRKAFNWQFEVIARVPIHSIELASTMRELKGV